MKKSDNLISTGITVTDERSVHQSIIAIKVLLSGFFLAILVSCHAILLPSVGTASLSLGIKLPASTEVSASLLPECSLFSNMVADHGGARFIHPDTRSVTVTVSNGGLATPIVATATIAAGESSASITIDHLKAGQTYTLTVTALDGPEGSALSAASSSVTPEAGVNSVDIGLIPVTVTELIAGSAGTVWEVGPESFEIYAVDIATAGEYQCVVRFGGQTAHEIYGLYGPDGRPVAGFSKNPADALYGRFSAARAGTYYLAVSRAMSVELDVRLDIYFSYDVLGRVHVMDSTFVRDSNLPVIIECSVPLNSATPVSGWPGGSGTALSGNRISVTPATVFTPETGMATVPVSLTVVDGILGETRTIAFDRAAFKRFVYLEAGGTNNAGPYGDPAGTLAIATVTAKAATEDTVAIVLPSGTNITEGESSIFYADEDVLIIGGCSKADGYWFKTSEGSRSTITCPADSYFIFNGRSAATIVAGIDFRRGFYAGNSQASLIGYENSTAVLYDCGFAVDGFSRPDAILDFSVIYADSDSIPFIRSCQVEMGAITQTVASTSTAVYGIRAQGGLNLVSSVVQGGTLDCTSATGSWSLYGVAAQMSVAADVVIVNSTIYAGQSLYADSGAYTSNNHALQISNGTANTWLYNSILLVDTIGTYDNPNAVYSTSGVSYPVAAIENCSFTDTPYIMRFLGFTDVGPGDLNSGGSRIANVAYSNAAHSFTNFANGDYRLTASSPMVLRSGGLDIFTTPLSYTIQNAASIDPTGTLRYADSLWSIGAYEY